MPQTTVLIFAEKDGSAPLLDWMDSLPLKVQDKCIVRIERLEEMGHELRRPEADLLRDGIHELRVAFQGIQYRVLYFFYERNAVISHGLIKERELPDREIELALGRKKMFASNPQLHTYEEETP